MQLCCCSCCTSPMQRNQPERSDGCQWIETQRHHLAQRRRLYTPTVRAESEILSKTTVHSNVSSSSDVRRVENPAHCGPLLSTPRNLPKVLRSDLLPKPQQSSNQSDGRRELPHRSGFKVTKGRGQTR